MMSVTGRITARGVDELRRLLVRTLKPIAWRLRRGSVARRLATIAPLPVPDPSGAILFFTPEAGVRPHFAAQCVVARTLKELGHRVLFVRCFELFERCPVMDMYELSYPAPAAARHDVCLRCGSDSIRMLDAYGLEHVDLRRLLTPHMRTTVESALRDAPDDLRQFVFDSVSFGLFASLDLVLATKVSEFDAIDRTFHDAWLQYIQSSVLSFLLVNALCELLPIRCFLHFEDYSLLVGGRLAARRREIPALTVSCAAHRNIDSRRYIFARRSISALALTCVNAWPSWRSLALSGDQVTEVMDDLITRLRGAGHNLFSPPKTFHHSDFRATLGLVPGKRVIVAYTSSLDERLADSMTRAAEGTLHPVTGQPFPDQVAWLEALIAHVESQDDLQLVVRVHPREGAGKRAGVSQHLQALRTLFDRRYRLCHFVWPDEPLSSYDLAEMADLVLVSWSTIGVELARMGVPVIASSIGGGEFPVDDFVSWVPTREAYFELVHERLGQPAQADIIARAFRWYHLAHLGASVDLGDVVPSNDYRGLPPFRMPEEARTIEQVVVGDRDILEINLERQRDLQPGSTSTERSAIRRELRRLVHFLFTGDDSGDHDEFLVNPTVLPQGASGVRILRVTGDAIEYHARGRTYRRVSPLGARLAPLCET